jgi:hypothetical protein
MLVDFGNPQQMTGIACFATATAACVLAARRGQRAWRVLAVVQAVFCLEIVFSARHRVHDLVDAALRDHDWYAGRTPWQLGLLVIVAALFVAVAPFAWRLARSGGPAAAAATIASLAVFALLSVEAVSLHAIDRWMYARIGPLLAEVVGWLAASLVVTVAALVAARR